MHRQPQARRHARVSTEQSRSHEPTCRRRNRSATSKPRHAGPHVGQFAGFIVTLTQRLDAEHATAKPAEIYQIHRSRRSGRSKCGLWNLRPQSAATGRAPTLSAVAHNFLPLVVLTTEFSTSVYSKQNSLPRKCRVSSSDVPNCLPSTDGHTVGRIFRGMSMPDLEILRPSKAVHKLPL